MNKASNLWLLLLGTSFLVRLLVYLQLRAQLDALSARLDPDRFMRVHKSAIVNLSAVTQLEREGDRKYVLVLSDALRISVSRASANAPAPPRRGERFSSS